MYLDIEMSTLLRIGRYIVIHSCVFSDKLCTPFLSDSMYLHKSDMYGTIKLFVLFFKKSLKIPRKSESVTRIRTDNSMANRKKDKQRSTKHTHKTKNQVTRIPLTH